MAFTYTCLSRPAAIRAAAACNCPSARSSCGSAIVVIAIVVVSVAGCGIKVVDTGQRGIEDALR